MISSICTATSKKRSLCHKNKVTTLQTWWFLRFAQRPPKKGHCATNLILFAICKVISKKKRLSRSKSATISKMPKSNAVLHLWKICEKMTENILHVFVLNGNTVVDSIKICDANLRPIGGTPLTLFYTGYSKNALYTGGDKNAPPHLSW